MSHNIEELRKVFDYNPNTGVITWKVDIIDSLGRKTRAEAGSTSGYIDTLGYRVIQYKGKEYKAHRLAWALYHGYWPEVINHRCNKVESRSDNRLSNLQDTTQRVNNKNKSKYKTNSSGSTGVHLHKQSGKWRAEISINQKKKHLGLFTLLDEAITARKAAEIEYGFQINHGR